jgi:hypothetical protein
MSRPVNQAPGALRDFNTLPANTYLPCREVLSDLHQAKDAQQATDCYKVCCGYLQALVKAKVIQPNAYGLLQENLLETWASSMGLLDLEPPHASPPGRRSFRHAYVSVISTVLTAKCLRLHLQ